jgi:cytochrome c553
MKTILKILGLLLVVLVLVGAGGYIWATSVSNRTLARTFEIHSVDFPIPYPLTAEEVAELGVSPEEAPRVAMERAIERGRHLVSARYACTECHGENLGGGVMVDAFPIGTLLGPNLTAGTGSRTQGYGPADWDRIVRHGVLPGGRPAVMPSEDFVAMSDRELSDAVAYLQSFPPVDNTVATPSLGPLGKVLMATGALTLSADDIETHDAAHALMPPATGVTVEFGEHLAATCTGCHGVSLTGGPIVGGDPSWPPAKNLTPHETGLAAWALEDFRTAMTQGRRPDGTELLVPMTVVMPYARNMTDVEMEALWTYLRSLPALPTGG